MTNKNHNQLDQHESAATQRRPLHLFQIAARGIYVLSCAGCFLWMLSPVWFGFDLLASQQIHFALWMIILTLLWCATAFLFYKRLSYRVLIVGTICAIAGLYPIALKREWILDEVSMDTPPLGSIRVAHCNIHPVNHNWKSDLQLLMDTQADVISVVEISPEMSRAVRLDHELENTMYPHWAHRYWVEFETSPCLILSKWPMRVLIGAHAPDGAVSESIQLSQNHLYVVIEHPSGDLVVGAMHPLSPRDSSRWSEGNLAIESQALRVADIQERYGLPIVVGADLNAGPAQVRASTLRKAGLSMSKPLVRAGGTFPANTSVPAPFQLLLDDVWTTNDLNPIAWSTIELSGSDHRAVIVDVQRK